jgi:hypothetical protein
MAQSASIALGQHFRLMDPAIATTLDAGRDIAVRLPAGAEVVALDRVSEDALNEVNQRVRIVWNNRTFSMFLVDVLEKCEPVQAS